MIGRHEKKTRYREFIYNDLYSPLAKLRSLGPSFPYVTGCDDDILERMVRRWITLDGDTGWSL